MNQKIQISELQGKIKNIPAPLPTVYPQAHTHKHTQNTPG